MTDFKVSIKISWEGMGVKDSTDMWINYTPSSECPGLDARVIEFFRENWNKAYTRYQQGIDRHFATDEDDERAEYERLKAKFG